MKSSFVWARGILLLLFSAVAAHSQCTFGIAPSPAFVDSTAQTLTVQVTASTPQCAWEAASSGFATISGSPAGEGTGTVTYSISLNSTGFPRTVQLTVAGQTLQLTQQSTATTFSDVSPGDFYFDAANLMAQNFITSGCATQPFQYCPDLDVTRGQAAVFIVRSVMGGGANADTFPFTSVPWFSDVPADHPFFKWIQKMKDLGITSGCGPTSYCPDEALPRDQAADFIIKARYGAGVSFGFTSTPWFSDVSPAYPFFMWIQKMRDSGITAGCSAAEYCPGDLVSRGEMAVLVMRGAFNLLLPAGTPAITSVTPVSGTSGTTTSVSVTGRNTHFAQGTTTATAGADISAVGIVVADATDLTAQFSIPPNVAAGPVSVVVNTGAEEAVGPNLFTITSTTPQSAVTINNFSFQPQTLTVTAGTDITWTNAQPGVTHTVTADGGSFGSPNIPSGGTFSQTMSTTGTYSYHCSIHPFMTGTITVQ
jgi:plastocyanin